MGGIRGFRTKRGGRGGNIKDFHPENPPKRKGAVNRKATKQKGRGRKDE